MSKSTLKTYIKNTADSVYSKYRRLQEADRFGYVKCVTCGKRMYWTDAEAGHYEGRETRTTRYDDQNVHPQCTKCNCFHEGRKPQYTLYLMKRYGNHIVEEIANRARATWKWVIVGGDGIDFFNIKEAVKEWRAEIEKMYKIKG